MSVINKVKSLGARATMTEDDVRALLVNDHEEAKKLAAQMCESPQARQRKAALAKLKPALTAHSRAEERVVYEAMLAVRGAEPPHAIAQEGFVEHQIVDELLVKLAAGNAASDAWLAHAKVLKELLEHHIEEEQTDSFAELGAHFSRAELEQMGMNFLREKSVVLKALAGNGGRSAAKPRAKATPRSRTTRRVAKGRGARATKQAAAKRR